MFRQFMVCVSWISRHVITDKIKVGDIREVYLTGDIEPPKSHSYTMKS